MSTSEKNLATKETKNDSDKCLFVENFADGAVGDDSMDKTATLNVNTNFNLTNSHVSGQQTPPTNSNGSVGLVGNNQQQLNLLSPQSSSSSSSNDQVHDLPQVLLQQGWRRFWSKREQRPYYFNKITNESLWEMPPLDGVIDMHSAATAYDPITDPLGIQSTPPPLTPQPVRTPMRIGGEKRPSTDDQCNGSVKKFIQCGLWDLMINTNAVVWECGPHLRPHPHPDVEIQRIHHIGRLRSQYQEMCRSRANIESPRESFSRWLMERKVIDRGQDPLLASACNQEISRSMYNEIMAEIPIKLARPKYTADARKLLSRYAEAAKKMIESKNVSPERRKIVKWSADEVFQWIRRAPNATFEDYEERLNHIRSQCQSHLTEAAKSSVEAICTKIYNCSIEYSKKLQEIEMSFLRAENIPELQVPPRVAKPKRVFCYPYQMAYRVTKMPTITYLPDKDFVNLKYKNETFRVRHMYLQKLETLYRANCFDDREFKIFLARVWTMLKRHQVFLDTAQGETGSTQISLTKSVFECLSREFGVTFECFASPLNCYYKQYCSAFGDTDSYFGSRGSILNFHPVSGSFQAFPPLCEQLIEAFFEHIDRLLSKSTEPLSFIVFIPEYRDKPLDCVLKSELSGNRRSTLTVPVGEYEFRSGYQHLCEPNQMHLKSNISMTIVFLQNDAGFERWAPTSQRVNSLMESLKIGHESICKEKDIALLSPPPTPVASGLGGVDSSPKDSPLAKEMAPPPSPTETL